MPAATHNGGAMGAHHLDAYRDGGRQAVDHLTQAVPDQQDLAMGIQQLRHAHGVGGEHDDRLFGAKAAVVGRGFSPPERGDGHPLARNRHRSGAAGRIVDRERGHGRAHSGGTAVLPEQS
jgi:hypothetical protein